MNIVAGFDDIERYEIIGEIGNFTKNHSSQDIILADTGRMIPIFPRGSYSKPFEWIVGYAAVGENIYVAVIKCMIPLLIWKYGIKGNSVKQKHGMNMGITENNKK